MSARHRAKSRELHARRGRYGLDRRERGVRDLERALVFVREERCLVLDARVPANRCSQL